MSEEKSNVTGPVDLTGLVSLDTFDLNMKIPGTNKDVGWVITLAGPSHEKTRRLNDDSSRKDLHKAALQEQARVNGKKFKSDLDSLTPQESRREFISDVVQRIVTWTPVAIGGKTYEFSDASATELLLKPEMGGYVKQIVDYFGDEAAFMPASATS